MYALHEVIYISNGHLQTIIQQNDAHLEEWNDIYCNIGEVHLHTWNICILYIYIQNNSLFRSSNITVVWSVLHLLTVADNFVG